MFDLLHLGHMLQFEKALKTANGTRLLVGVLSDKVRRRGRRWTSRDSAASALDRSPPACAASHA